MEKCEKPITCRDCGGIGIVGKDGSACNCAKYGSAGKENCRECGPCRKMAAAHDDALVMFTVYYNPSDHPGKYVVRPLRVLRDGTRQINTHAEIRDTLDAARACIPRGKVRIDRDAKDDPVIVEVWL